MTQGTRPKGPRSSLSQLLRLQDPFPWMLDFMQAYDDPATVPILGQGDLVLTWSPEGAKEIFTADPDTYTSGVNDALAVIVGEASIFLLSGAKHRRARKLLAPPFHGERMRAWGALMRDAALRHAKTWTSGATVPVVPTTQAITLDIIIESVFGVRDPAQVRALHDDIVALVAAFNPLIAGFKLFQREFGGVGPWARFQRIARGLHEKLTGLIASKRATPGDDIVSLLLAVRDEDGDALTEQEVTEQLLSFVIAGHETTATSLAWALYALHRAPETLNRLRDELSALGPSPAPDALAKSPYLEAVCQETLRMYPPVPMVTRKLAKPLTLRGYTLPEGSAVGVGMFMTHHRAALYPEPLRFRPERFLERTYNAFEWMPFGGGARRCLGAAFAMYEMKVVLATLLSAARFTLAEPKPVGRNFRIGTFGPATGVRMTITPT